MWVSGLWSVYNVTGLLKIHFLYLSKDQIAANASFSIVDRDLWVVVNFWLAKATGLFPWPFTVCSKTAPIVLLLLSISITYGLLKSTICIGSMVAWQSCAVNSSKALFSSSPHGILLGTVFPVKSVTGLAISAKFSMWSRKYETKSNQPSHLSLSGVDFHIFYCSHSLWIKVSLTTSDYVTNIFDMTLSKFAFFKV